MFNLLLTRTSPGQAPVKRTLGIRRVEEVDLSELKIEHIDDPTLIHTLRTILAYEQEAVLNGYARVYPRCGGDKREVGSEYAPNGPIDCFQCAGVGRI